MKHPTMIDSGTLSCYFNIDELKQIEEALYIAREEYGKTDWSEIMDYDSFLNLQDRIRDYIKIYQRRMKDGGR